MEMLPDDSPDSHSDIGRILSLAILPVPLWLVSLASGGTLDPVSMYRPYPEALSTLNRTASQSEGASCHSSMSSGASPRRSRFGSIFANEILLSLILALWRLAVFYCGDWQFFVAPFGNLEYWGHEYWEQTLAAIWILAAKNGNNCKWEMRLRCV